MGLLKRLAELRWGWETHMAKVFLIDVDQTIGAQISNALAVERHRAVRKTRDIETCDLSDVDIVFAGGKPSEYLPLLRRVRGERPALPFVVVTRLPETHAWLEALEAGATDY